MKLLKHLFRSASSTALLLTVALSGSDARAGTHPDHSPVLNSPSVTKTEQFQEGTVFNFWCARMTYCYQVDNPARCVIPVDRFCVTFNLGLHDIDVAAIQTPPGWTFTVDQANNRICFDVNVRASGVQPGNTLGGFKVPTSCNPGGIEGRQDYDLFGWRGRPALGNGLCSVDQHYLYGEPIGVLGGHAELVVTSSETPFAVSAIFLGAAPISGLPTPFGDLRLDPFFIQEIGHIPLDPLGLGAMPLPIPPDPNLAGFDLPLQAITLGSSRLPKLSNLKILPLR